MNDYKIGFAFIEAHTANGKARYNEWSSHSISGVYEVVEIEETKIWLKEDKIRFPVMKDKIKTFEVKEKPV